MIKCDSVLLDNFSVNKGIKQDGILYPKLFNIHVNTLTMSLDEKYIGCCLNGNVVNHLYYADNLVLFSTTTDDCVLVLYARKVENKTRQFCNDERYCYQNEKFI